MTNEELAVQIQHGRSDLMPVLWDQVKDLIAWKAENLYSHLQALRTVEVEDLIQSGYFAVLKAVDTYDPESGGKFTSWLYYHLQTVFAETAGWRTQKQRQDPADHAVSLNAPVKDDEGNETEKMDLTEDPNGVGALEAVEDDLFQAELEAVMKFVMSDLPEDQKQVLYLRYWADLTSTEAGARMGLDPCKIIGAERNAIRALREPRRAKFLRPFCDYDFYQGTGLQAWRTSGMSVQERYLVRQEK